MTLIQVPGLKGECFLASKKNLPLLGPFPFVIIKLEDANICLSPVTETIHTANNNVCLVYVCPAQSCQIKLLAFLDRLERESEIER